MQPKSWCSTVSLTVEKQKGITQQTQHCRREPETCQDSELAAMSTVYVWQDMYLSQFGQASHALGMGAVALRMWSLMYARSHQW